MNSAQRRIFRRAVSASLGLSVGASVAGLTTKGEPTSAKVVRVSPTGGRNVLVKLRNNSQKLWPLSTLQAA